MVLLEKEKEKEKKRKRKKSVGSVAKVSGVSAKNKTPRGRGGI